MSPIPVTLSLPEILESKESARVLIWSHGKWEIAWLMDLEDGSEPMWCCDNEQSVDPDPTYWMPLPEPASKPCVLCGKPMIRVHARDFDGYACLSTKICTYKEPILP